MARLSFPDEDTGIFAYEEGGDVDVQDDDVPTVRGAAFDPGTVVDGVLLDLDGRASPHEHHGVASAVASISSSSSSSLSAHSTSSYGTSKPASAKAWISVLTGSPPAWTKRAR